MAIYKSKTDLTWKTWSAKSSNRRDFIREKPFAPLLKKKKQNAGRNHHGRITVRHMGGGHKTAH